MVLSNLYLSDPKIMFINLAYTCKTTLVLQDLNFLFGEKILTYKQFFLVEYTSYRCKVLNNAAHTLH